MTDDAKDPGGEVDEPSWNDTPDPSGESAQSEPSPDSPRTYRDALPTIPADIEPLAAMTRELGEQAGGSRSSPTSSAPERPSIPRPPRPRLPQPRRSDDARTAVPPSVNPAGPPPREPFGPARSPEPPIATGDRSDDDIDAMLDSLSEETPSSEVLPPTVSPVELDGAEQADEELLAAIAEVEEATDSGLEQLPASDEAPPLPPEGPAGASIAGVPEDVELDALDAAEIQEILTHPGLEERAPDPATDDAAVEAREVSDEELAELGLGLVAETAAENGLEPAALPRAGSTAQPASTHLAEAGQTAAWIERAAWIESQAETMADPRAQARSYLVASELWAITGDRTRARQAAEKASKAAPRAPSVSRQARTLALTDDDPTATCQALDLEARSAPTAEGRVHASLLCAEIYRLKLGDETNAARRFDQALRTDVTDPRAWVAKLARELSTGQPPAVRLTSAAGLAPLIEAQRELALLRSPGPISLDDTGSLLLAFEAAARAMSGADPASAGRAIERLAAIDGLEEAALALAASLTAPRSETRPEAIRLLRRLSEVTPSPETQRALAARALEQGAPEAIASALQDTQTDAFSAADRVALAALTGAPPDTVERAVRDLDEGHRPLGAAAAAVAGVPGPALGDPTIVATLDAGRSLGQARDVRLLEERLSAWQSAAQAAEQGLPLRLELARLKGHAGDLARELTTLGTPEANWAAGLVVERSGDPEAATDYFRESMASPLVAEAATRAIVEHSTPDQGARVLAALGGAVDDTERCAALLFEGALRLAPSDASAALELASRAIEVAPHFAPAYPLAEGLCRAAGDVAGLLDLVERRRQALDPAESARYDDVRVALTVAEEDAERAIACLDAALLERPEDAALQELRERLDPAPAPQRGEWRRTLASTTADAATRRRLLLEAAFEYFRAGDGNAAAEVTIEALRLDPTSPYARRLALSQLPATAAALAELITEEAKQEQETSRRVELYEILSNLEQARGDRASALWYDRAILEEEPGNLRALRHLEHSLMQQGDQQELRTVAMSLVDLTDAGEATAHAMLAARLQPPDEAWEDTRPSIEKLGRFDSPTLWILRARSAHALAAGDDAVTAAVDRLLSEQATTALDGAALSTRAADALIHLERHEEALAALDTALERAPDYLAALWSRASLNFQMGRPSEAAQDFERLANQSGVESHKAAAWKRAAWLWLDHAGDSARGLSALEHAADHDVEDNAVFDRLQLAYVESGDREKLADLLERRLASTTDPEQRLALEVSRGRALADVGDRQAARQALSAALEASPDHADALEAYANLCATDGDWDSAEQAWIRLARAVTDPAHQAQIYRRLASLYDTDRPNPSRSELCYREVLKREPDDVESMKRLVNAYVRLGDVEKAVRLQTDLVGRATTLEEKRDRTLGLSRVYEEAAADPKRALDTLEKARKAWPHDGAVLAALAQFHQRRGEEAPLKVLLDRAATDARRALGHGRFDPAFFRILVTVAELRNDAIAAAVTSATLGALEGKPVELSGAGAAAGAPSLDDLLAPELLSPGLRALLAKLPGAMDQAYPLDLRSIRAAPLPAESAAFAEEVREIAEALGIRKLEVLASPALGFTCAPAASAPPRIVFGQAALDHPDPALRYFLLFRCLKIVQSHAAALSRLAPVELWPAVAGLLSLFVPGWVPQGVDASKVGAARERLQKAIPSRVDDDVPILATELSGALGSRASQLAVAVNQWGGRAALLAVGSPATALRALALASDQEASYTDESSRLKWVMRNQEARDLAVFSVSDAYAEARRRLGLAG